MRGDMSAEANGLIERIKQKLDIVEEIGAVVPLKKSGRAFRGLCPFHGERTPSFYVLPDRGTWHCFGCGEGGDLFTFVQKQQGLDFREALAVLAERAGIPLDTTTPFAGGERLDSAEAQARQRLRELNEAAAIWFHHRLLQSPDAQYARSYLDSRGVSNDALLQWRLGYAPDGDALARYLREQGYGDHELLEAGLTRAREGKGGSSAGGRSDVYDYFRNRLIFPIRDSRGRTIAFGGRELGGGHPKYLNTPQTPLFDKSATLYGLDLARDGIRRQDRVIIVEGYMDAIVTHQHGSRNVVACIGSAITEKHIRQIKKLTRRVTLCLDPDAAGESATLRGITVAQQAFDRVVVPVLGPAPEGASFRRRRGRVADPTSAGSNVATNRRPQDRRPQEPQGMVRFEEQVDAEITVMRLPAHEDPDEFIRRDPQGWQQAIVEALPLIDYLIEAQTAGLALDTPQGKMEACRRLLPIIAEVRDRTLADEYVGRLAQRVRLDKVELRRDLHRARQQLDRTARPAPPAPLEDDSGDAEGSQPAELGAPGSQSDVQTGDRARSEVSRAVGMDVGLAGELMAEQIQAEYCLGMLFEYPDTWQEVRAILTESDFAAAEARALYSAFAAAREADGGTSDVAALPVDVAQVLREVAERARARVVGSLPDEDLSPMRAASQAAYRLKRMRIKMEVAELDFLQRDAEQSGDREALRALLQRKQMLLTQRRAIDAAAALIG
jgi:DNA primase